MPETPPTSPYPQPGMIPANMQPVANIPVAPAPDAAAKPPGNGSPKAASAAFLGNLDAGIHSVA